MIGNKARALIEMQQLGLHVPAFFVLDHGYYVDFLKRGGGPLSEQQKSLIHDKLKGLQADSWIVRCSCNLEDHPFQPPHGIFKSSGKLSGIDDVINAVEACWRAACSEQVLQYCERFHLNPTKVQMAVIIQQYLEAEVAGTLFTTPPKSGNDKEMFVEAIRRNTSVPSESIVPSRYRLPWFGACTTISGEENNDVFLKPEILAQLRFAGHTVQAEHGKPYAIEFLVQNGVLFLIQSQAINHLRVSDELGEWSTSFFREEGLSSSVVSPLTWSLVAKAFASALPDFLNKIKLVDAAAATDASPWFQVFYARPYWNLGKLKTILGSRPILDANLLQHELGLGPQTENARPVSSNNRNFFSLRTYWQGLRSLLAVHREVTARLKKGEQVLAAFDALEKKYLGLDWQSLSKPEFALQLGQLFEDHCQLESEYLSAVFNIIGGKHCFMPLFRIYHTSFNQLEYVSLIADLGQIRATKPARELQELALFLKSETHLEALESLLSRHSVITPDDLSSLPSELSRPLRAFVTRYYYHSEKDLDLRVPRWSENLRFVCAAMKTLMSATELSDLGKEGQRSNEVFQKALNHLQEAHRRSWLHLFPGSYRWSLKQLEYLRTTLWLREELRDCSLRMYFFIRRAVLELARRKNIPVDATMPTRGLIFYSSAMDLLALASEELPVEEFLRRAQQNRDYAHGFEHFANPPEIGLQGNEAFDTSLFAASHQLPTLQGIGCSSGQIKGRARVITDISQASQLKAGEILVTRITAPSWTPLFTLASGIVAEAGGLHSHTALISREYGIPSVLNVSGATELIKDGQEIEIDGSGGEVYLY